MQTYARIALPLAVVCGVLTLGINAVLALVITINMFMPHAVLPLYYYEFLHFPFLSVFLPFVAALALAPLALKFAFSETVTLPTFHLIEHDDVAPAVTVEPQIHKFA
jgi:hypothetical protein